jgi:hypothetical protein
MFREKLVNKDNDKTEQNELEIGRRYNVEQVNLAWKGSHMYSIQYIQAQAVLMGIL